MKEKLQNLLAKVQNPLTHKSVMDDKLFVAIQDGEKPVSVIDMDLREVVKMIRGKKGTKVTLTVLRDGKETQTFDVTIVRDKIGSFKERDEMQSWLQAWILKYVDGDPAHSSETTKAQKPLAAAEVIVEEVEGNPGYYMSKFFFRPHYQLEGLTVSLRLVFKLPSAKAA